MAHALVRRASRGELAEALRIHQPAARVVAFGRRDTLLPGFPGAVAAARRHGFTPVVRATGGRAVAYTEAALVFDHVRAEPNPAAGHDRRFEEYGGRFVEVFRRAGVDARLGPVPGEYCPGAHSVNARGVAKLVGTAQRVVKNAWLFSSLVVVGEESLLRPVLDEVYRALGQPFDPASVGSLLAEAPALDPARLRADLAAAYGAGPAEAAASVDPATWDLARALVPGHRV